MPYSVYIKQSAEKELDRLPSKVQDIIIKKLTLLGENPTPKGVKKLQAKEGYRIRVGDYRILYIIDESKKKVEIISIAHRKDIYR